ncbi:CD4-1 molecule isoform X1 [Denticeps clupeoides]|uniref:CD4-1 molecule isoform X1 n=1 Tax=Denticeps clupeoides TaxID=299321 RepID=UPI0010A33865|nr:uncharacterized protein LOC114790796 isoform X1 [Denticeps clupeoides]
MNCVQTATLLLISTYSLACVALPQYDVVYGQVGGAASFNCEQWGDYLNWYFGNTSEETATLIYNKHALGPIKETPEWKDRIHVSDISLKIKKIQDSDFGYFKCEQFQSTQQPKTKIYHLMRVTLSDPPSVFINDMLTLNCDVETNDPMPKIRWIPPDSVTDQRAKYVAQLKGPELSFRDPTWKDNGVWTCLLKYDSKKTNATATVRVLAFVDPGPTAFEGDTVNLTCSLGHPLTSDLKVKWVAPRLGSNETPHLNSQFIFTARQSKAGKYKCELCKGEHIVTSAEVKLKIEKAPVDTWLWVGICSTGLIVIMLIFIGTTLLRRYRKRMMMHRRKTRFCCCKNPKPQKGFYKT